MYVYVPLAFDQSAHSSFWTAAHFMARDKVLTSFRYQFHYTSILVRIFTFYTNTVNISFILALQINFHWKLFKSLVKKRKNLAKFIRILLFFIETFQAKIICVVSLPWSTYSGVLIWINDPPPESCNTTISAVLARLFRLLHFFRDTTKYV